MIAFLASSYFLLKTNTTSTIYTLSLHDALPILGRGRACRATRRRGQYLPGQTPLARRKRRCATSYGRHPRRPPAGDRKSTRLNSSHVAISYAVFCLKKKTQQTHQLPSMSTILNT